MGLPQVRYDFNKLVDLRTYSLATVGSRADLKRLRVPLRSGIPIELFDDDVDEAGQPTWLIAAAVTLELPGGELAARVEERGFRHEPTRAVSGRYSGRRPNLRRNRQAGTNPWLVRSQRPLLHRSGDRAQRGRGKKMGR